MSQNDKKQGEKNSMGGSNALPEDLNRAAEEFVDFLQNSESKNKVKEFILESYKQFEADRLAQFRERMDHEKKSNEVGASPGYTPGNIEPVMHDDFNMTEVEQSFARSLKDTKNNLLRSVEDRVEEINRLLSDIGGFSAQLKSSFARSTVVFLEQEDPIHNYRERLIFSINLPNYELKRPWDGSSLTGKKKRRVRTEDGRSSFQITWEEAVNCLSRIVESAGLKPKYCKNDRNYGRFVMKQDLRSNVNLPDEYFSFTLDYNTDEKIREMSIPYDRIVKNYETKISRISKKVKAYPENSKSSRYSQLKKKELMLNQERDFFVGTTPDPSQLDEGLLFLIEVSTLKDYHVVKDKMQIIMTKYIMHLSKIASSPEVASRGEVAPMDFPSQPATLPTAGQHPSVPAPAVPIRMVTEKKRKIA